MTIDLDALAQLARATLDTRYARDVPPPAADTVLALIERIRELEAMTTEAIVAESLTPRGVDDRAIKRAAIVVTRDGRILKNRYHGVEKP